MGNQSCCKHRCCSCSFLHRKKELLVLFPCLRKGILRFIAGCLCRNCLDVGNASVTTCRIHTIDSIGSVRSCNNPVCNVLLCSICQSAGVCGLGIRPCVCHVPKAALGCIRCIQVGRHDNNVSQCVRICECDTYLLSVAGVVRTYPFDVKAKRLIQCLIELLGVVVTFLENGSIPHYLDCVRLNDFSRCICLAASGCLRRLSLGLFNRIVCSSGAVSVAFCVSAGCHGNYHCSCENRSEDLVQLLHIQKILLKNVSVYRCFTCPVTFLCYFRYHYIITSWAF